MATEGAGAGLPVAAGGAGGGGGQRDLAHCSFGKFTPQSFGLRPTAAATFSCFLNLFLWFFLWAGLSVAPSSSSS
jgi:hypothetical protein